MLDTVCQSLEASALGLLVRESIWGFPILVGVHILSLAFSVGMFVWFDFRLLGFAFVASRVSSVYRRLMPFASFGFLAAFVTGMMLFTGFATAALGNTFFRIKLLALLAAGVNATVYHVVTERDRSTWDDRPRLPVAARAAGAFSLALWTVVILCGRMMSYTMF
ncbi:MAG: hypothetical protein AB7N65_08465 [Vicinamibacterales bacterium]